jgi:1-acyl-sn-glycerol-3-phosphate acyltransferase
MSGPEALRHVALPTLAPSLPRKGGALSRAVGRAALRLLGWRVEGAFPDVPRFVLIGAPHTSNWDGVVALAAARAIGLEVHILAKRQLFRPPLGPLLRALGGVPVDRDAPGGVVEAAAEQLRTRERFILAIAPEGTRKKVEAWKTGFHRIAVAAGVPVVALAFDWEHRRIGPIGTVVPTGDVEADLAALRALYAGVRGRRPEWQTT